MGTITNGSEEERKHTNRHGEAVLLLTMVDAARVLSVGRTTMYELVSAGDAGRFPEVIDRRRDARPSSSPHT